MAKKIVALRMGHCKVPEVLEQARRLLVTSMKGSTYCLHVDKLVPDFNGEFKSGSFPLGEILDHNTWISNNNYKKIVKEDENVDAFGNQGNYMISDEYRIAIVSCHAEVETGV